MSLEARVDVVRPQGAGSIHDPKIVSRRAASPRPRHPGVEHDGRDTIPRRGRAPGKVTRRAATMSNEPLLGDLSEARPGRRAVLRGTLLAGAGLAAAALVGCGADAEEEESAGKLRPTTKKLRQASSSRAGGASWSRTRDCRTRTTSRSRTSSRSPAARWWSPRPGTSQNIDPTVSAAGGTVTVPNMIYNRLHRHQARAGRRRVQQPVLEPELAKSWERSPDGLTFTFKIDPGVKWQNLPPLNGRPFVAADAAYAMDRYATDRRAPAVLRERRLASTAVDDATLKVKMKRPVADFLNPLGQQQADDLPSGARGRRRDQRRRHRHRADDPEGADASAARDVRQEPATTGSARSCSTGSSSGSCRTPPRGWRRSAPARWTTPTRSSTRSATSRTLQAHEPGHPGQHAARR